jgi:hypothetical protein
LAQAKEPEEDRAIDVVSSIEAEKPIAKAGTWQPPPLELVVFEPLEDEARRSASRKSDAELAEIYEIALSAHEEATHGGDREGEADYWHVLQRAIVEEAARRPDFGKEEVKDGEAGSRRQRRRRKRFFAPLIAARDAESAPSVEAS